MDYFWDYVHRGMVYCGSSDSMGGAVADAGRNLRLSGHINEPAEVKEGRIYIVEGGSEIEVANLIREDDKLYWTDGEAAIQLPEEE